MNEINLQQLLLGFFAIGYSIFTYLMRKKNPQTFWKLEPMKLFWGKKLGYAIHFIGYTAVPFILGSFLILKAFYY